MRIDEGTVQPSACEGLLRTGGQTALVYTDRTPPRVRLRGLDFILLKTPISVGGGGGGLGPFPRGG